MEKSRLKSILGRLLACAVSGQKESPPVVGGLWVTLY
jgi:hypothetical protein